jgi:hypothetical protein
MGEMIKCVKNLILVGFQLINKDRIYNENFDLIFVTIVIDVMYCLNVCQT